MIWIEFGWMVQGDFFTLHLNCLIGMLWICNVYICLVSSLYLCYLATWNWITMYTAAGDAAGIYFLWEKPKFKNTKIRWGVNRYLYRQPILDSKKGCNLNETYYPNARLFGVCKITFFYLCRHISLKKSNYLGIIKINRNVLPHMGIILNTLLYNTVYIL